MVTVFERAEGVQGDAGLLVWNLDARIGGQLARLS
jgi:hypothetical protein